MKVKDIMSLSFICELFHVYFERKVRWSGENIL